TRPIYGPAYAHERRLDRATTTRVAGLATNSRYTASEIKRIYGRDATVVTMGVPEALLDRPVPARSGKFILSVGALVATKGHELVLRTAAAAAGHEEVVIVAPRPDRHEEARLQALAGRLRVTLSVRTGISDAELADLYATAHATLYLARREPLGLVSLEAQACGCPVLVADEGGLPETVVDGTTGWRIPRTPDAAAAKLALLDDVATRTGMSAAAREHARRFTWQASGAQIQRLLAELKPRMPEHHRTPRPTTRPTAASRCCTGPTRAGR
ncbi:MAG: glycosyltransferase family 4 protein, partial [Trebonia sp.]